MPHEVVHDMAGDAHAVFSPLHGDADAVKSEGRGVNQLVLSDSCDLARLVEVHIVWHPNTQIGHEDAVYVVPRGTSVDELGEDVAGSNS